jgi:predicted  nucleic acid-binding Zn-ribbon protein
MLLNIKESAKFAKVSRTTIYAKISSGKLSKSDNNLIDTSELLRVFGNSNDRDKTQKQTQLDTIKRTLDTSPEIDLLNEKIRFLESNLSDARNREEWLRGQVDKLTEAVKLLQAPRQEKEGFFSRLFSIK